MEEIGTVVRAAVALVFLVSALAKLFGPTSAFGAFGVLRVPEAYRVAAARSLGLGELAVAGALLTVDSAVALLLAAGMLVVFSAFLAYLVYRGNTASCGCLGDIGSSSHVLGLVRNLCMLALIAVAAGTGSGAPEPGAVAGGLQLAVLLFVMTDGVSTIRRLAVQREDL